MREIYVISDTHFFHEKLLTKVNEYGKPVRPFDSVEDMNETIVKNWNNTVNDTDLVYHLGDVTWKYNKEFHKLFSRLKGVKRLCLGNHDKVKELSKYFQEIYLYTRFPVIGISLSHMPLLDYRDHKEYEKLNIHGHLHEKNVIMNPHVTTGLKYKCVSVEQTYYKPIPLDDLISFN